MENQSARPIALALLCSSLLHLFAVTAYLRWYAPQPPTRAAPMDASELSVSLRAAAPGVAENPAPPVKIPRKSPAAKPPVDIAEPGPVEPIWPAPREEVAAIPLELNPVPILQEEYSIDMATLAVQAPMEAVHRDSLRAVLNRVAERLPEWTDPAEPLRWQEGGSEYRVRVERRDPASATGLERAVLTVTTELEGLSLSAQVPVKRLAFSHFAQVVDRWNPGVSLSSDSIHGRFHSNSELWVDSGRSSRPLVTGPTTVAGRVNLAGSLKREQIFTSGLITRAPRMDLPADPLRWEELSNSGENVHRIERDARLVFDGEAGYRWHHLEDPGEETWVRPAGYPWLIVAGDGVELQVEGTVSGSVLVYSPARITVTGDLTYTSDPRSVPDSIDFLGLVSDRNVEVAPPAVTGPGDLEVFASVFARRQFRVRRYRHPESGELRIHGSLTAGSLSATEPRYATRLEFDERLEQQRPAYFPLTNRYIVDGPVPDWTVEMPTAQR